MPGLFRAIFGSLRENLGHPVKPLQLLLTCPQLHVTLDKPAPSICAGSIPHWHKLGADPLSRWPRTDRGTLVGWRAVGGHWESFRLDRPEYAQIGQRETIPDWQCDITDIHGFSASKSNLKAFASTDDMVETNSPEMIDEITSEKLAKNLAHREIRIIHSPDSSDYFTCYFWDGRLWLMNSGGSHHTAAAKYIAARLRRPVKLNGKLYTYSLNPIAIDSLHRDFEMFVIGDESQVASAFFDAMRSFKATWLWHPMPHPYTKARAVLLPRNERRSMRVAEEFHNAGIADLGAFLTGLAARQPSSEWLASKPSY